ncbi:hypothetical protein ACS0TY_006608 [Phlomoides rotata]
MSSLGSATWCHSTTILDSRFQPRHGLYITCSGLGSSIGSAYGILATGYIGGYGFSHGVFD